MADGPRLSVLATCLIISAISNVCTAGVAGVLVYMLKSNPSVYVAGGYLNVGTSSFGGPLSVKVSEIDEGASLQVKTGYRDVLDVRVKP
jgi:hypothetical protein